jgi:DNA-binding PadR family transcriptional regulator
MTDLMLTQAELAVLSLVAEEPRHGYQVEQLIEQRGMRAWTEISFSSIYFLLNKLEKRKLIQSHLEPAAERGPARKVYQATPAGHRALFSAVNEALSVPRPAMTPFLLGLGNLPVLPPEQALAALEQYRAGLAERLAAMEASRAAQQPLPYFVDAMFGYSKALIQAEQAWVEGFVATVQKETSRPFSRETDQGRGEKEKREPHAEN